MGIDSEKDEADSMKVIEFCGNPGCGKTTLCGALGDALKEQGFSVFHYNEVKEKKTVRSLRYLRCKSCRRTAWALLCYGSRIRISRRTFVYSLKCAVVLEQIRIWRRGQKMDYLLFDEGILQYVTTLSHAVRMDESADEVLSMISAYYSDPEYYVVDCKLPEEENIRRLRKRNRQGDRFLLEDEDAQRKALRLKRENLDRAVAGVSPRRLISADLSDGKSALESILRELGLER